MTNIDEKPDLRPGHRVKFTRDRKWWTVREADTRYVILTRQADFRPRGESFYTIIDWDRGIRGPCNLIGQGWEVDEPDGCASLLRALNRTKYSTDPVTGDWEIPVEISHRNNVPITIVKTESGSTSNDH